jgi:hypothetical protein
MSSETNVLPTVVCLFAAKRRLKMSAKARQPAWGMRAFSRMTSCLTQAAFAEERNSGEAAFWTKRP